MPYVAFGEPRWPMKIKSPRDARSFQRKTVRGIGKEPSGHERAASVVAGENMSGASCRTSEKWTM
jgi:hypothetical protein